ncbi:hypothetical protein [Marinobacterium iners]|uniref:hypothetical protein n=1 Tax=Marinobacterium iners TaxID=48076 RepID=UPI001A8F2382|nr:hypothetical protein [Marinobacterium iners]
MNKKIKSIIATAALTVSAITSAEYVFKANIPADTLTSNSTQPSYSLFYAPYGGMGDAGINWNITNNNAVSYQYYPMQALVFLDSGNVEITTPNGQFNYNVTDFNNMVFSELALSGSVTTNTGNLNIYDIFLGEVEQVNGLNYGVYRMNGSVGLNIILDDPSNVLSSDTNIMFTASMDNGQEVWSVEVVPATGSSTYVQHNAGSREFNFSSTYGFKVVVPNGFSITNTGNPIESENFRIRRL